MAAGRDSATAKGAPDIRRLLAPRSVAIIGASANPASMGARALSAFRRFHYAGDIHLVNPRTEAIDGIRCVPTVADLPQGVDAAIFAIPQPAVAEALAQGIARGLGGAVIFSAGYAETGPDGRRAQDALAAMARAGGLALAGPNCLGLVNFDAGVPLTSGPVHPIDRRGRPGLAVIAQSGGIMGAIINASEDRDIPLSHAISTGNEAALGVTDYFAALVGDPAIGSFALFAEQIRDPQGFLASARRARDLGKPVILLHSGRSARAQEASLSHTGAVASNFRAMEAAVRAEGVLLVDGMDRLIDVAEMVSKFRSLPKRGLGIITDSGAFKGLALDTADDLALSLPELKPETYDKLRAATFDYVEGSNPLDVTGQAMMNLDRIYGDCGRLMLADGAVDALLVCQMPGKPEVMEAKARAVAQLAEETGAAVGCVFIGSGAPVPPGAQRVLAEASVPLSQSGERAIRAVADVLRLARPMVTGTPVATLTPPPLPGAGTIPEHLSKAWLARAIALPVPLSHLATTPDAAASAAETLGFPVVLKVQHADLAHKSDVGGVLVGLATPKAVREGFTRILRNVEAARPGQPVDGILVEKMGARGPELVIGAKRDADWGPMVMIGMGGVWVELFQDMALIPAGTGPEGFRQALLGLKAAKLLTGYRGDPPVDLDAAAAVAARLGAVMLACPEITEIDLNPVIVRPAGEGVLALDALIVTHSAPQ